MQVQGAQVVERLTVKLLGTQAFFLPPHRATAVSSPASTSYSLPAFPHHRPGRRGTSTPSEQLFLRPGSRPASVASDSDVGSYVERDPASELQPTLQVTEGDLNVLVELLMEGNVSTSMLDRFEGSLKTALIHRMLGQLRTNTGSASSTLGAPVRSAIPEVRRDPSQQGVAQAPSDAAPAALSRIEEQSVARDAPPNDDQQMTEAEPALPRPLFRGQDRGRGGI